jgi:hypothetical protein
MLFFFLQIHTKKGNILDHKRVNKLVYVSYNKKMTNRFQKIRELGCKGKRSNPLLLEEFQGDSEWVDENSEEVPWAVVDEVTGASENLRGRNLHRAAATRAATNVQKIYTRNKKRPRRTSAAPDISWGARKKMTVTMLLMLEMKPKKINMHMIMWYQWRRMKTPVEMEEAFV